MKPEHERLVQRLRNAVPDQVVLPVTVETAHLVGDLIADFDERLLRLYDTLQRWGRVMPCGHLAAAVASSDEGTNYCRLCKAEAAQRGRGA